MQLVSTTNNTYLAMSVRDGGDDGMLLESAVAVDSKAPNDAIARAYVLGTITDKVTQVRVMGRNLESIQEAVEITPLVDLMMKYVPLAEKQAKANLVIVELTKLMSSIEGKHVVVKKEE